MDDIKQFKSLSDLKSQTSELQGFIARPVTRGQHPTIYPEVQEGRYRTVSGIRVVDVYWVLEKSDLPKNMKFVEDLDPKKKDHFFLTVTDKMRVDQLVSNLKSITDRMSVIKNAERAL